VNFWSRDTLTSLIVGRARRKKRSGPIDNPREKPKTLRETQSGRLQFVATRRNKHPLEIRSIDFREFFRPPKMAQSMRRKLDKSFDFSPSSQRNRPYSAGGNAHD